MPDWSNPECQGDDTNAGHLIERHDVYPEEAEHVFSKGPHVHRVGGMY